MTQGSAVHASDAVEDAVGRLREIDGQIRKYIPPATRRDFGFNQVLRDLTFEEWSEIVETITTHSLPCALIAGPYGFWLCVYEHSPIQGETPDQILVIAHGQFPVPSAKKGFGGQAETLRILSSITHSKRNAEVLAWYGFDPLRDPGSYEY